VAVLACPPTRGAPGRRLDLGTCSNDFNRRSRERRLKSLLRPRIMPGVAVWACPPPVALPAAALTLGTCSNDFNRRSRERRLKVATTSAHNAWGGSSGLSPTRGAPGRRLDLGTCSNDFNRRSRERRLKSLLRPRLASGVAVWACPPPVALPAAALTLGPVVTILIVVPGNGASSRYYVRA